MSAHRRRLQLPTAGSVLDEMLGGPAPHDQSDEPTSPPEPVPDTPHTPTGEASDTHPPRVTHAVDAKQTRTRTPEGRRRHTLYLATDVATELDEAADAVLIELRSLVPRHVVLAELIRQGTRQRDQVAQTLREELLRGLST